MQFLKQLQQNKNHLMIVIGATFAIILFILMFVLIGSKDTKQQPIHDEQAPKQAAHADTTATSTVATSEAENPVFESEIQLIDEQVLSMPVNDNPTLAADELAQLTDIEQQLLEQQALLEEQHLDADQLIALKEEQIALLEQQLAEQSP